MLPGGHKQMGSIEMKVDPKNTEQLKQLKVTVILELFRYLLRGAWTAT